ncbi:hypothetical protein [Domibacillus aminovorans]|uniref:Uncharacterized protein n=1 Tax=Domibacillus aminovorans TaxID=29332 RepID=A0A177LAY4_9BACI|nr:hypothetical protein [Domibacillus aminovorans]OAH62345.1 hypothetical protein AWH49_10295 [Domibacillus aminovorans]
MAANQGQNSVEPIRDPEQIRTMKEYLLHQSYRDSFLFIFGINLGLGSAISCHSGSRTQGIRNIFESMKEKLGSFKLSELFYKRMSH